MFCPASAAVSWQLSEDEPRDHCEFIGAGRGACLILTLDLFDAPSLLQKKRCLDSVARHPNEGREIPVWNFVD